MSTKNELNILKNLFCGYALFPWAATVLSFTIFIFVQFVFWKTSLWLLNISLFIFVMAIVTNIYTYIINNKNKIPDCTTNSLIKIQAEVIRDSKKYSIDYKELVLGDLVEIKCGDDLIPADIRIIKSEGLKVDNSIFTGETIPQKRTTEFTDDNQLETSNLVFYKTKVVEGSATGIVIRTGNTTFANRLGILLSNDKTVSRPIAEYVIIIILSIFGFLGIIGIILANMLLF